MKAYQNVVHRAEDLVNTAKVANHIVCLPIYSHMSVDKVEKICFSIYRIHHAKAKGKLSMELVN